MDIELTRAFYETRGLVFVSEQHGTGPKHYAAVGLDYVLELYPAPWDEAGGVDLGFEGMAAGVDPDGRTVLDLRGS